ncbi:MAG: hypothetical protein ACLGGX_07230 [Bdellovibrionia bacterium]
MLYGRRTTSPQPVGNEHQQKNVFYKSFQYRYSWYLMTVLTGSILLFLIPAYYFAFQNFKLLQNLAYDVSPSLLTYLEREMSGLSFFFIATVITVIASSLYLSKRLTQKLMTPLIRMEAHMKELTRGNWQVSEFESSSEDDLKEFSMTYDFLQRSLKQNLEQEYKLLSGLYIDPKDREAFANWRSLMKIYEDRLGSVTENNIIVTDVKSNVTDFPRRAS